ncbi:MAG: tRNA (adenosine(37)-N6)-threonylcarbamoyltransferase complex dimerization subunit type 1 TsaB [Candidatus Korobacteraceae bacterium]
MLIVAIDTSGRHGSVALCSGDADRFEVLQLSPLEGGTYSARLMPTISLLLEQNHFDKKDVDGFVVVSGPGSFTGLRVGLATVKGLCEVLHKPLATVSMLEAVAVTHGPAKETVTAVLDAGRSEVYVGEYRPGSASASLAREYIAKLAEFAAEASGTAGHLLTPDASVAEFLQSANVRIRQVAPVQADEIGRIGLRKLLAGDVADAARVDVNYIRRSDAEVFSAPKG